MAPVYVRSVSEFGAPRETFGDATRLLCFPHISRHGSRGAGGFIWVYFHCDVMQFTISLQFVIIDTQIAGATILFFITDPPDVAGCNRGLQSLSRTTPQSILGRTHTPPEKKKHTLKEEIQGPLPSHSCEYVPNPYLARERERDILGTNYFSEMCASASAHRSATQICALGLGPV